VNGQAVGPTDLLLCADDPLDPGEVLGRFKAGSEAIKAARQSPKMAK